MSMPSSSQVRALVLVTTLAACADKNPLDPRSQDPMGAASFTKSTSTSTLLGRATFSDPKHKTIEVTRRTDDWRMEIESKPAFDVAVQSIVFKPGEQSGWHSHPGPVLIQVVAGTVTFYESDDPKCRPIVRTAGQGFVDKGEHAHLARNEDPTVTAQTVVTYFAPPGAALRIDQPQPSNCHV